MNHDWDELASAYLDGEASDEEIALVESTPEAMDIVAEFRAIAAANANVPAASPEVERNHKANALAAFDDLMTVGTNADDGTSATAAPSGINNSGINNSKITDLTERRNRRTQWLATAAAGVVIIAGFGIASSRLGGGQDETATESTEVAASPSAADGDESAEDQARATAIAESAPADAGEEALTDNVLSDGGNTEDSDTAEEDSGGSIEAETITAAPTESFPLAELTPGQDLFTVIDALESEGTLEDPSLRSSDRLDFIAERCPTEVAGFVNPVVLPVLYDGRAAELFFDRSGPQRALVITSTCSILAADERS